MCPVCGAHVKLASNRDGFACATEAESGAPRHTGVVDEDGFCRDLLAVQAMSGAMVARQVITTHAATLRETGDGPRGHQGGVRGLRGSVFPFIYRHLLA